MATATRPYGGVSAEDRRAARRERLLDAGLELLGSDGWSSATVKAICAEAGLTERYFYESFGNRDEMLVAVFDRVSTEAIGRAVAAVADAPGDERAKARAAVASVVEMIDEDRRKGRVLFVEAMGSEPLVKRRLDALTALAGVIGEQARAFYGDAAPSGADIELNSHALAGAVFELLLAWVRGDLETTPERLVDHCTELFVAAAGVSSAPG
jgi:AcrR family transcriptional regulator